MGTIVCKFGGTSTASGDMFMRIRGILEADPDRQYVVLSAPGRDGVSKKVTDMLCEGDIDGVVSRFENIADDLGVSMDFRGELDRAAGVSEAAFISRGEYLCARLFSGWSGLPFVDATDAIRFRDDGRVDEALTRLLLREMAHEYPRAVIPGFYGAGPDGGIMTFPRNGSDITGALVAAGTGATLYENWTDVPGLMTGDPATDPGAEVIPEISYTGMWAMCADGARVLHPDCLAAVERAGIPTRIKCTIRPELPGTLIR